MTETPAQSIAKFQTDVGILHDIVHGNDAANVTTEAGTQPSLAKRMKSMAAGASLSYASKSAMDADLLHAAPIIAMVSGDGTNDGLYSKVGGSGSGSWSKIADFSTARSDTLNAPRPGDAPDDYMDAVSSSPASAIPSARTVVASADGKALRMVAAGILAERKLTVIEPGRTYRARLALRRSTNPSDPGNDVVQFRVAWFDSARAQLSGGNASTLIDAFDDLLVVQGREVRYADFGSDVTPSGTIAYNPPAGAIYALPYVQTFGGDGATDISVLGMYDITEGGSDSDIPPDLLEQVTDQAASAAASEALAGNWASLTGDYVITTLLSAREWAVGTFKRGAAGFGSAKDWAMLTGAFVDDANLSAKEWAQGTWKRGVMSFGSAKDWAILTGAFVDSASMSAKEWAVGVWKRGVAGYGSAKDWATLTGATVDDVALSAKEWAIGIWKRGVAGCGSAKDWAILTGTTVDDTEYSAKHYSTASSNSATSAAAAAAQALGYNKIYANIAAAQADSGLANGSYYTIPSPLTAGYLDLYLKNSGSSSTYQKTAPSVQYLQNLQINGLNDLLWSGTDDVVPMFADANLNRIIGVSRTTGRVFLGIDYSNIQAALGPNQIGGFDYAGTEEFIPLFTDANQNALLSVSRLTGAAGGLMAQSLKGSAAPGFVAPADKPIIAQWNGLIAYGQSLSLGAKGQPPISTSQPYSNLTFGSGPKSSKSGNGHSGQNSSPGTSTTIALVEDSASPDGSTGRGETICSGAANNAVTLAAKEAGLLPSNFIIFASTAGHGAYRIDQLYKGAAWYEQYTDHVSEAYARAVAAGKTYALHAVPWIQGEQDIATSYASYLANFLQLATDLDRDARAITGQVTPVHTLTYQVSGNGGPALAQLDGAKQHRLIHLVTPIYHLPRDADATHLTPLGYLWMGQYFGRAYKQLVIDGRVPDCITPISATVIGTALRIRFRTPTQLQFDTSTLAVTTDNGFKVVDDTGTLTLSSLACATMFKGADGLNYCDVTMTLNRTLGTNPIAKYARDFLGTGLSISDGASGNLRDSTADTFTYSGTPYPLYHVAPAFELPISTVVN